MVATRYLQFDTAPTVARSAAGNTQPFILAYSGHYSRNEPCLVPGTLVVTTYVVDRIYPRCDAPPCCAEAQCSNGLVGVQNGDACCDADCGTCGGSGCAGRPGGNVIWCLLSDYRTVGHVINFWLKRSSPTVAEGRIHQWIDPRLARRRMVLGPQRRPV